MPTRNNQERKVFQDIAGQHNHPEGIDMTKQLKMREGQRATLLSDPTLYDTVKGSIEQRGFTPNRTPLKPKIMKRKIKMPKFRKK